MLMAYWSRRTSAGSQASFAGLRLDATAIVQPHGPQRLYGGKRRLPSEARGYGSRNRGSWVRVVRLRGAGAIDELPTPDSPDAILPIPSELEHPIRGFGGLSFSKKSEPIGGPRIPTLGL